MIGDKVRALREQRGWSQIDLANQSGLSLTAIRNLEQGLKVTPRTRRMVSLALDVSLAELGGPIAWHTGKGEPKVSADEEAFSKKLNVLFDNLQKKLRPDEIEFLLTEDNWFGFCEVAWLIHQHGLTAGF